MNFLNEECNIFISSYSLFCSPRVCRIRMKVIAKSFYARAKVRLGKQWQLRIWDWNFEQGINHFKRIGVWDLEMKLQWPIYPFSNSARLISFFICEAKVLLISFIQRQKSVSPFSWEDLSEKVTATQSLPIDKMYDASRKILGVVQDISLSLW